MTLIGIICLCYSASAQMAFHTMQSRNFTELYIKGPVNVECRNNPDSAGMIVFRCTPDILPLINCNNSGNRLSISTENVNARTLRQQLSTITVYYSDPLSTIAYTGDGLLFLMRPPMSHRAALAMTGSGRIKASGIKAHYINCAMAGSGSIAMSGTTDVQSITCSVSGSGAIEIAHINANTVNATVKGPGDMIINGSTDKASFALKGSGVIDASALNASSLTAGAYGSGKIYYNHRINDLNTSGREDNIIKR